MSETSNVSGVKPCECDETQAWVLESRKHLMTQCQACGLLMLWEKQTQAPWPLVDAITDFTIAPLKPFAEKENEV